MQDDFFWKKYENFCYNWLFGSIQEIVGKCVLKCYERVFKPLSYFFVAW
jgi:hypothetical protein